MDQEKIGKLIAKLRKEKGLTQQELGDKVGVGYRAVSKWETGLTMPDISNINELCKILGITSDELLKGELNKKNSSKSNNHFLKQLLLIIIPIIIITVVITGIIIKHNNKSYEYDLKSANPTDYQVKGKLTIKNNRLTIQINKIQITDYNFKQTIIKNYEYRVLSKDKLIVGFGYNSNSENLLQPITINEFLTTFKINYDDKYISSKKWLINNNMTLEINFIDIDGNRINKQMEILLISNQEIKSTNWVE